MVKIGDGPDLDIQGNILDHEYTFTDGRAAVATVSKRWFRVADTYGVEVSPSQNPVVILAATVALGRDGPPGSVICFVGPEPERSPMSTVCRDH